MIAGDWSTLVVPAVLRVECWRPEPNSHGWQDLPALTCGKVSGAAASCVEEFGRTAPLPVRSVWCWPLVIRNLSAARVLWEATGSVGQADNEDSTVLSEAGSCVHPC